MVKTDSLGNIEWENTIGGDNHDWLKSVKQTSDGGYILGGYSGSQISGDKTENSWIGSDDYWVVKLDPAGVIEWQNTIQAGGNDELNSIQQCSDGGYILGGYSTSNAFLDKTENSKGFNDYWVVKLDSTGAIQWDKTIGGNFYETLYSIEQTSDEGYILGGISQSDSSGDKSENNIGNLWDYWVVKLDSTGVVEWENTIGGSDIDELRSIQQTSDGGYILGGFSMSDTSGDKTENKQGYYDYWVVKLDSTGNILWQNTIGGSMGDYLNCIKQTTDDGYILGGFSGSDISGDKTEDIRGVGTYDYWVIKLNDTGNIQWQRTIGGEGGDSDYLESILQTSDGGYMMGGLSNSNISGEKTEDCMGGYDFWIVKLSCAYEIITTDTAINQGDSIFLQGSWQTSSGLYYDTLFVDGCDTVLATTLTVILGIDEYSKSNQFTIYPNPTEGKFTISSRQGAIKKVEVYDLFGRKVLTTTLPQIDMRVYAKGVYFVRVGVVVKKVILQ